MRKIHSRQTGFTIAEMLVALVVMSLLLTAIATAFNASAANYRQNAAIAEAMNSARQVVGRMTTLIRTGQPSPATEAVGTCSLITAEGHAVVLRYNAGQSRVYYDDTTDGTSNVLCENVTRLTFAKAKVTSGPGSPYVKRVVITMTITIGDVSETITSAAVVRKNI